MRKRIKFQRAHPEVPQKIHEIITPSLFDKFCETCYTNRMKKLTVRDLRLHWPKAEKLLKEEAEIVITRHSEPVAKLIRYYEIPKRRSRKRFNAEAHMKWLKEFWKDKPKPSKSTDEILAEDREDRDLI